jgi:hypothetical protein
VHGRQFGEVVDRIAGQGAAVGRGVVAELPLGLPDAVTFSMEFGEP